jgi:uncharacterized protein YaaN involved in tellurite resistance
MRGRAMVEFNIDVDKIVEDVTNKEVTKDKTTELVEKTVRDDLNEVNFLSNLPISKQEAIQARAPELVEAFLADQNTLLDFGNPAVAQVNNTVNNILSEQKNLTIPQVDDLLKSANRELNGFAAKYKDVKTAELETRDSFLSKLFKRGKNTLQEFYFDSKTVEGKMDEIASQVVKQEDVLSRNVISAELLIEDNSKSIESLVGVIAFIEASRAEAGKLAEQIQQELPKLGEQTVEYQEKSEELAHVSEVVNLLEQQHTEYVSRLYVAWSTTPQMRNLIKVSSDMKQKLGSLRRNTIPTMKLALAQLGIMQQSLNSERVANSITKANNDALNMLAETSKKAIPMMESAAQNTSMDVNTVANIAASIVAQNQGIITAIEQGRVKRNQIEQQILRSVETINDSVSMRDEKIIQAVLQDGQESQKEIENAGDE